MTATAPAPSHQTRGQDADVVFAGVSKRIGATTLLDGIDLVVPRGQRVAMIGPSGAGKTTLLRLCAGVLWPSDGEVTVLGRTTGALRGHALCEFRSEIGFLHQQGNLVPALRVAHNVLMGKLGDWSLTKALWSLIRPQEVESAHRALQQVELGDRLWAMPGELSGGEQQRVAIARLLVQDPKLLLADEPVSALDIRLGREVVRLILAIAQGKITTIVSLHYLDLLTEDFDRVIALRAGRLVFDGKAKDLTRTDLREIYDTEYQDLKLDELGF